MPVTKWASLQVTFLQKIFAGFEIMSHSVPESEEAANQGKMTQISTEESDQGPGFFVGLIFW